MLCVICVSNPQSIDVATARLISTHVSVNHKPVKVILIYVVCGSIEISTSTKNAFSLSLFSFLPNIYLVFENSIIEWDNCEFTIFSKIRHPRKDLLKHFIANRTRLIDSNCNPCSTFENPARVNILPTFVDLCDSVLPASSNTSLAEVRED